MPGRAKRKGSGMVQRFGSVREQAAERIRDACARLHARLMSERAQGTTEYAILVGVIVVIAIIAITVFRPKLEELWNAIADGINSL